MSQTMVFTCEHAGNKIPDEYRAFVDIPKEILNSHRGWDPGALQVSEVLSNKLSAPFYYTEISRLLIEANRSIGSGQLFSEFTSSLPEPVKSRLLESYWRPYRSEVELFIQSAIAKGNQVIHYSVHSFTPVWNGVVRPVDIGLLFDDDRISETQHCQLLRALIQGMCPDYNVVHNEPYSGKDDGFTTYLRTRFPSESYLGIEIEINQKFTGTALDAIAEMLSIAIKESAGRSI